MFFSVDITLKNNDKQKPENMHPDMKIFIKKLELHKELFRMLIKEATKKPPENAALDDNKQKLEEMKRQLSKEMHEKLREVFKEILKQKQDNTNDDLVGIEEATKFNMWLEDVDEKEAREDAIDFIKQCS